MTFNTTRTVAFVIMALLFAAPLDPTPSWTYIGPVPSAALGHMVAGLGDVNGDGFDDVAVGTIDAFEPYPGQGPNLGRTFVFFGSQAGLSLIPQWSTSQGGYPSTAYDVNGDGFRDLFVKGHGSKAFVFLGSPGGFIAPPSSFHPDIVVQAIVGLGDTSGDGFGDAAMIGNGLKLFKGSPDGIPPTPFATVLLDGLINIAAAGDVNGDGLADLLLSTMILADGRAAVIPGQLGGMDSDELWSSTGDGQGGFGSQVAGAGDVDGDGFDDILVSAPSFSGPGGLEGKAYLYRGSASGPSLTPSWTVLGAPGEGLGFRISSAGDVNGDGFSDVAVTSGGNVLLFLGSAAGLSATPDQVLTGGSEAVIFGWALASAGDVDGDGASELLVGDPFFLSDNGKASLFSRTSPTVALKSVEAESGSGTCGALGAEAGLLAALAWLLRRRRARRVP